MRLGHAWQCLESARAADNRTMQAIARNAIGWCHVMLGEYEVAIGHCEQALAELEELGSVVGQTDVWDSLGHAHRGLGQYRQAIDYHQRAVRRCRELGDRRQEATYLVGLGETHHVAGERDAGLRRGVGPRDLRRRQHPDMTTCANASRPWTDQTVVAWPTSAVTLLCIEHSCAVTGARERSHCRRRGRVEGRCRWTCADSGVEIWNNPACSKCAGARRTLMGPSAAPDAAGQQAPDSG